MRKPIPEAVQTNVLLKSRRRCSVCYGLNRDTGLKQGQIAHLNHNSGDAREENLVFLCLDHHDQYDSQTSQSKNLRESEVTHFRDELYTNVDAIFSAPQPFGYGEPPRFDGHYIRVLGGSSSAEITVKRIANDARYYRVSGEALYGTQQPFGPNIG